MTLQEQLGEQWYSILKDEFKKEYMIKLSNIIKKERKLYQVYPKKEDVFKAFRLSSPDNIRVVIVGQDCYYNPNLANGLAFSVQESLEKIPPSLSNIFTELEEDYQRFNAYHNPDLTRWAKQGVFLLNRSLTVRHKQPNSHSKMGWEIFTEKVIDILIEKQPKVFILWGANAIKLSLKIPDFPHYKILSAHPSPLSAYRGFFGSKPFSRTNRWLKKHKYQQIDWFNNQS